MDPVILELERAAKARDAEALDVARRRLFERGDASTPGGRDSSVRALAPLIRSDDPRLAAEIALGAGALVETGASADLLAEILTEPVERWLVQAVAEAEAIVGEAELDDSALDDPERGPALASLDVWYRPAVATWTRAPERLREVAARARLREALDELRDGSNGAFWMWMLMSATRGERFVVLVPAARTAYAMTLDGVVDMGQLTVLASHALAEAFRAIGAPRADDGLVATMRGEGRQRGSGTYSGNVHFYPWQALDPTSAEPVKGRFTWTAPGGTGTHSLPADFLPSTIEPLEGHRVLALFGPRAGAIEFTRILSASRVFSGLVARVDDVEALGTPGFEHWMDLIRRA